MFYPSSQWPTIKCWRNCLWLSSVLKSLWVKIPDLCWRFSSPLIRRAFWLLSEELSSNMQKKLTVTIVAYYDIQKEQLTIWDAKIRPKSVNAGVFFFFHLCFFHWLQNDNKIHRLQLDRAIKLTGEESISTPLCSAQLFSL